jgi:hypothetical protein
MSSRVSPKEVGQCSYRVAKQLQQGLPRELIHTAASAMSASVCSTTFFTVASGLSPKVSANVRNSLHCRTEQKSSVSWPEMRCGALHPAQIAVRVAVVVVVRASGVVVLLCAALALVDRREVGHPFVLDIFVVFFGHFFFGHFLVVTPSWWAELSVPIMIGPAGGWPKARKISAAYVATCEARSVATLSFPTLPSSSMISTTVLIFVTACATAPTCSSTMAPSMA